MAGHKAPTQILQIKQNFKIGTIILSIIKGRVVNVINVLLWSYNFTEGKETPKPIINGQYLLY